MPLRDCIDYTQTPIVLQQQRTQNRPSQCGTIAHTPAHAAAIVTRCLKRGLHRSRLAAWPNPNCRLAHHGSFLNKVRSAAFPRQAARLDFGETARPRNTRMAWLSRRISSSSRRPTPARNGSWPAPGVDAEDIDVKLVQGSGELRHATFGRLQAVGADDRALVAVERDRLGSSA